MAALTSAAAHLGNVGQTETANAIKELVDQGKVMGQETAALVKEGKPANALETARASFELLNAMRTILDNARNSR